MNITDPFSKKKCITFIRPNGTDSNKSVFLTFDDGPDQTSTEKILNLLKSTGAKATFFCVANKAQHHASLLQEIQSEHHKIGNHSLDHHYKVFFSGKNKMLEWIIKSEDILNSILAEKNIGFRSPAGIRTPELHWALDKLQIPLIHWNKRFFDTQIPLTHKRVKKAVQKLNAGDIILLHDGKSVQKFPHFLENLEFFIQKAQERGFLFKSLNSSLF